MCLSTRPGVARSPRVSLVVCLCKTTFRGGCGVPRGDRGLGSDQDSCMTFTPCPSRVGPSVSGRIAELWRRRHPGPLQSPRRPAGGEETGASGGSRGPNSVTRSLPSLSTGNPGLPAGCGKVREGPRPAHRSPDESKHRSRARGVPQALLSGFQRECLPPTLGWHREARGTAVCPWW